MAAAYRVVDRTHAPLTSPLEDPNPSTAHLKIHWPSSFQRLQETFLQSDFCSGVEYSNVEPGGSQFDVENLIVFNVYKFGPSSSGIIWITSDDFITSVELLIVRSVGAWVHPLFPLFTLDIRSCTQRIGLSQNYQSQFR